MAPRICTPMLHQSLNSTLQFLSACTLPMADLSVHNCLHKLCLCIREQCPELLKINTNYLLFLHAKIYIYPNTMSNHIYWNYKKSDLCPYIRIFLGRGFPFSCRLYPRSIAWHWQTYTPFLSVGSRKHMDHLEIYFANVF